MPALTFEITLIRHGETEENVRAIIQGQADTKLNETGVLQARLLATTFPIGEYGLVYSSDLSRAYDTCKELVLGSPGSSATEEVILTDRRLRERSFGPMQGQALERLISLAKEAGQAVSEYTPDGGETPVDVRARLIDFIENRLIADVEAFRSGDNSPSNPLKVLLVSHGGVIREIIAYFLGFGHHSFRGCSDKARFIPPNTSVNEFRVHYSPASRPPISKVECLRLHDMSHLSEEQQSQALKQKQVNDKGGPGI